ncbi:hypothetical protein BRI6_1113 [plant metagenome]|uniref:Uncharacterized protein n=1 Tax=plant metagenome TaxID=1297885 RepID=A0A484TIW0_9ZZZZ
MAQQEVRPAPGRNGFKYRQRYGVIVICTDEAHQQEVYQALKRAGYTLKVVAV